MKTNSIITITRENKTIVIYVNDGDWRNVPDLSFIADVEIYDQPERSKREDANKTGPGLKYDDIKVSDVYL